MLADLYLLMPSWVWEFAESIVITMFLLGIGLILVPVLWAVRLMSKEKDGKNIKKVQRKKVILLGSSGILVIMVAIGLVIVGTFGTKEYVCEKSGREWVFPPVSPPNEEQIYREGYCYKKADSEKIKVGQEYQIDEGTQLWLDKAAIAIGNIRREGLWGDLTAGTWIQFEEEGRESEQKRISVGDTFYIIPYYRVEVLKISGRTVEVRIGSTNVDCGEGC